MSIRNSVNFIEKLSSMIAIVAVALFVNSVGTLVKLEVASSKRNLANFKPVSLHNYSSVQSKKDLVNLFFRQFVQDFKKYHKGPAIGVDLSNIDVVFVAFPKTEGPRNLALCYSNPVGNRAVIFDTIAMEESSYTQLKMTVYHELGHCALDLEHDHTVSAYTPKKNLIRSGARALRVPAQVGHMFGFSRLSFIPGPSSLMYPTTFPEEFLLDYEDHFLTELFNRSQDFLTRIKCDNASKVY